MRSENELIKELIQSDFLNASDVDRVYDYQKKNGSSFIHALTSTNVIDEDTLYTFISSFLKIDYYATIKTQEITSTALERISPKIAFRYKIIPLFYMDDVLTICISNPFDMHMIDDIRTILNSLLHITIAKESEIDKAITVLYGVGAGTIDTLDRKETQQTLPADKFYYEKIDDITGEASIIKFVNQILLDAYTSRATDIHIEPFSNSIFIRYRIDGVMHDIKVPQNFKQYQSSLVTRIKIIANLDISEHRMPQDGRIKISTDAGFLDLRVSVVPTTFGESVNIRILSSSKLLQLDALGFDQQQKDIIMQSATRSYGIVFLTGPTGSGKTTTLYAALNLINNREKKIITVEDPIEYQIEGITQIQVHPKIGLNFSTGLRSILRHDPDVIMIGEVRDSETAEIAIRSSLTGHLVLSTLHTNDAPSAIARLIDMNVEPYLISASVQCVIAQRLIRVLCSHCKQPLALDSKNALVADIDIPENALLFEAVGCHECVNTGYHNRTVIAETMRISEEMSVAIGKNVSQQILKEIAHRDGMVSMRVNGLKKVFLGMTTFDEIMRLT
jgi:type II secretory ATPase GspE/PulE/Tfp pilus assembly ATPase PilB-like protein